jgi:hypothetical protein
MCLRCHRPARCCVCDLISVVPNRTGVIILQHARERRHPIGTERLARLGLAHVRVVTAYPDDPNLAALGTALPPGTALLYPGPGARDLTALAPGDRPSHLLVLDGTWSQAHVMYRDTPWLAGLPHVALVPTVPSQYRIRRQPRRECLSTIEAVVLALRALEPETPGLDGLLAAFAGMVDRQAPHGGLQSERHKRPRLSPRSAGLHALSLDRLLVVRAEVTFRSDPGREGPPGLELLQWAAVRPATGERFESILRPVRFTPSSRHLAHLRIPAEALAEGTTLGGFREAWARFRRPDERLAVWTQTTADAVALLLGEATGPLTVVKTIYCNQRRVKAGTLAEVVAREGLASTPEPVAGRGGPELGHLLAVVRWLAVRGPEVVDT